MLDKMNTLYYLLHEFYSTVLLQCGGGCNKCTYRFMCKTMIEPPTINKTTQYALKIKEDRETIKNEFLKRVINGEIIVPDDANFIVEN